MINQGKQFEDFIRDIKFDDTPDPEHRDKLEKVLLAAHAKQPRQVKIWRIIMKSRITQFSAVAAALIAALLISWLWSQPDIAGSAASFTMLDKACAAEEALFYPGAGGVAHIATEIVLYPGQVPDAGELLSDLESDVTQDKNLAFLKSWLSHRWFPVYSLGADGHTYTHKLELATGTDEAVTLSDLAWYDAVTGRFERVLRMGDQVLFANSYDGEFIYVTRKGPDGGLQVEQETVTGGSQVPPENPADFLGIAAGIKASVPREHFPPIQDVTSETLEDGTPVRVYKLGFADPWGKVDTYFLFKISTYDDVISEIECVVEGRTTSIHRRVVAETVDNPEYSWNLAELTAGPAESAVVNVEADAGAGIVTVQEMAQRATFPVYIFSTDPSWAVGRKIYDEPDEMSPPARFFPATYRAKDGRDIVLVQGESFNRYFAAIFSKVQEQGESVSWTYVSENGFKALHQQDKEGEMFWTEFALKSSGFEPTANRVGYILMSPADTFMVLAINGPVSDEELKALIDSLIPANEYMGDSIQP